MNWTALVMIAAWVSAAVGSIFTRDWLPFFAAMIATLLLGMGYLLLHSKI